MSDPSVDFYAVAWSLVQRHFGDDRKADLWMESRNPLLGDLTPVEMIRLGRGPKLMQFIRQSQHAASPPPGLSAS